MRVLLINTNRCKDPIPVLPMGLCSIAASLEKAGHTVQILDLCFARHPGTAIQGKIASFAPDIVGLGIRNIDTSNGYRPVFFIDTLKETVISPLKSAFTGPIVIGGPAAGINGPDLLDLLELEYAIAGDGERALCAFADRTARNADMSGLAGLIIRRNGRITEANPPDFIENLDELPIPSITRYLNLSGYRIYGTPLQIQTKRGCALACSYCTYNRLEGKTYRLRSPEIIANEIESLVRESGIRAVEIVDSTFNTPPDHAAAVLTKIIGRNLHLRLSTMGLSPRHMDAPFARLMKQAGFIEACFGVEAACDQMLQAHGKNFTVDDIRNAAKVIHRQHIPAAWFLLLGAPGETSATIAQTVKTISRIAGPGDLINIGVGIRVLNGAPVAARWAAENNGPPSDHFLRPVSYQPSGLSTNRIKALAARATALHHNFFMFDDNANILLPFRIFFNTVFRRIPLWRAYIFMRMIEKITGIFIIRWAIIRVAGALHKNER